MQTWQRGKAGKILNLKKHTSGRAVNAAFTNCLTPTGSRGLMTEGGRGWNLLENRSLVSLPVRRMLAFVKVGGKKTAWCFSTCVVLFFVFCFQNSRKLLRKKKKKSFSVISGKIVFVPRSQVAGRGRPGQVFEAFPLFCST